MGDILSKSKRLGRVIERAAEMENLRIAFHKASKGKSNRSEVIFFRENLEYQLFCIRNELLSGEYELGQYRQFVIYDPKKRIISAAPFRDRVVFHAVMSICHDKFESYQVYRSCASRVGKGTYQAIEYVKQYAKKYKWFTKLDVCHYFDTINHEILISQLSKMFKDPLVLNFFSRLLDTYHVKRGEGIPIGNLTSQYFANHYLAVADHYLLERIHAKAVVRYMDDYILLSNDRDELLSNVRQFSSYLSEILKLKLHNPICNNVKFGIPFLGYVVYPNEIRLNQRSRKRFNMRIRELNSLYEEGYIDEYCYRNHYNSLRSFVDKANSINFVKNAFVGS